MVRWKNWQFPRGERYYVETGYAFDHTLQAYDLDENTVEQIGTIRRTDGRA